MGEYATTTSISELMPFFLSGNTTTSDSAGASIFARMAVKAESVVNAAVSARYSLPFTTVPPLLRSLAEDIACYFSLRGSYVQDGQNRQEYMDDYKQALETLEKIEKGSIKLTLTDGSAVPTAYASRFSSNTKDYTPIFGLDDETAWGVDADLLSAQEDARE